MSTNNDEKPMICFFKCGISPELELSREYKMKMMMKKRAGTPTPTSTPTPGAAQPSAHDQKPAQSVTIGAARSTKVSCADCLWEGAVLVKTPEDVDEDTLSNSVLPFCFPEGIKVYSANKAPSPVYYSFPLTSLQGDKSYVTCIVTYEPFADVAKAQEKHPEYLFGPQPVVPVCYCLMSRIVCTEFSRAWLLKYINAGAERGKMIERVLACRREDRLVEGGETLPEIPRPNPMDIHFVEGNVYWLFQNIGVRTIVDVFFWLLEEQKVLFLSDDLALLGECIATIAGLLYPFTWMFQRISPLPASLIETTQGPGAVFNGMLRRSYEGLPGKKSLTNLVVVDLDKRCVVQGPEETFFQPPESDKEALSARLVEALRLFDGVGTLGWSSGRVPSERGAAALQLRVRGIFLSYFAEMFRTHRSYLLPLRVYPRSALAFRFIEDAFVGSVDKGRREYAEQLIHAQMFQYFIENRPWPAGDAFDTAIAGEIWKVSTADLADFMAELSAAVAPKVQQGQQGPQRQAQQGQWGMTLTPPPSTGKRFGLKRWVCQEIRSVPQGRVSRSYAEYVRSTISAAVPDFYRIQAEGVEKLKGVLGSPYGRLLLCETFFRGVESSQKSNPWDVSVGAWESLGNLFAAVVARAYEDADYLTLRYATEIIKECRTYKDGNHGLYERCMCNEAAAKVYRNSAVWERMFACSMAEIYRKKYCGSAGSANGGNEWVLGEGMYGVPAAQQEEYGEAEWALARTEFVYFAQMMEAFGVGDTVHRIISSSIVNFDFDKCNRLIEDLKPQEEYRRKVAVEPEKCLPYGYEGSTFLVLWVDDKNTEANVQTFRGTIAKKLGSELEAGFNIVPLVSSDSLRTWLVKYGHLLPGAIKVVTNYYRAFDGGEHAAQRAIDVVRKDPKYADIPIMIFCGNSGIGNAKAVAAANKDCKASTSADDFIEFCREGFAEDEDDPFFSLI